MELKIKGKELNAILGSPYVSLGAGFVVGSLAGFLLGRHVAKRVFTWQLATEVEAVKQFYKKHYVRRTPDYSRRTPGMAGSSEGDHRDERATAPVGTGGELSDVIITGPSGDKPSLDSLVRDIPAASGDPVRDEPGPDGDYPADHPLAGISGDPADQYFEEDADDGEDTGPDPDHDPSLNASIKPFIISEEEFGEVEGFSQVSLTYYAADKILVDDKDKPIRVAASVAGKDFAKHFGDRSGDSRIVYVRNNRLQSDYEIKLHDGSYSGEVLHYGNPQ